ncbi:hypothetical protein CONCODRAFT_73891 [Conidiobolus coronatus NRRL 28638]|uniref:Extracellular membrane protein CFEM domain-containing protein n=1 Tax=Conidiobolus coronatus (strain ATCC 28846 / CBS 209.66 / NRRL 28638) TaxID=796925 RepID=A0A137NTJ3_CONC2|nr:hypothetical protein CONCODRAFT_73891 [Conidiobolus coronatus NRRL 28638]|eukprot:KXN66125.1 hypothetical protein CONCODRAFT_73891 [Conidiobolus coronatus NRRL 28638]
MKRTGLIWILFQLDTTLPIQLSSNYPYQLPPSNLINSYLTEWQAQHEALRNQWNEQEREREIDKQKQENVKTEAKPKLKLTNPAALRLAQQPLSSQPRVQAEDKAQANLQPVQNAIQSPPSSQSLASLAPDLGKQLEKLKQSPILQDKNNRALFQTFINKKTKLDSNGCACVPNDYACNNECVQQRMLQQASSVIGCMTACAAQSIGAIQNCMLGCSNVYYAQVTAPVPTPVTETPSPSSSTNAPSSTQQQSSSSSSETPTTTSSSQESSTTSTSSDSSTTTDSSSSTTSSETTTPTSSQSSTSSSPTPTNSGNPNINGTVDGTDDDDDDDSALIIGAKHTLIVVSISTLLTLFVI